MSSQRTNFISPEEYLAQERRAERKSEYIQGEIVAMSGASRRHGAIVTNLVSDLWPQLKKKSCQLYTNDIRLRVTPAGLYTYPDLMVVCGEAKFADDQKDTVFNPALIIEVLSDSTRDYDLGRKFEYYRSLPSLMEYLTIAQDEVRVAHWTRKGEKHWDLVEFDDLSQSIPLTSVGCTLSLNEAYYGIRWPDASGHG